MTEMTKKRGDGWPMAIEIRDSDYDGCEWIGNTDGSGGKGRN